MTPQEGWATRRGVPVRLFNRLSYWNANTKPSIPIIPGSSKHREMKKWTQLEQAKPATSNSFRPFMY